MNMVSDDCGDDENEWNNENDGDVRLANLEITDSFIFSHHQPDHPTDSSS